MTITFDYWDGRPLLTDLSASSLMYKLMTLDENVSELKTETFTIDTHIRTGLYTKTFTIDMIPDFIRAFTIDQIVGSTGTKTWTIDGRIATSATKTMTIDEYVSTLASTKTMTIDEYVMKQYTNTFTLDQMVAALSRTKTFTLGQNVSTLGSTDTFTIDQRIATSGLTKTLTIDEIIDTNTIAHFHVDMRVSQSLGSYTNTGTVYYALNNGSTTIDITDHMEEPKVDGLTNKLSRFTPHDNMISDLHRTGIENLRFEFDTWWFNSLEYDTFIDAINTTTENAKFFYGSPNWYYRVRYVSVTPTKSKHLQDYYIATVRLEIEDPYMYHEATSATTEFSRETVILPFTTITEFWNAGQSSSPLYSIIVTGHYAGSSHLKSPTISIMNGSTIESSLLISDRLLSEETMTIDVDGVLTTYYHDDFSSSAQFARDCYASSLASVYGGTLGIGSGGYATYKFYGPHPTYEPIALTAIITTTGSPYIQCSSDNSIWYTAVRSGDITSGSEDTYYLNYSEKQGDVYIRFYCPSGSTMTISDMTIESTRDTSFYTIPEIDADDTRTIKLSDASSSSHSAGINLAFRSRKWAG